MILCQHKGDEAYRFFMTVSFYLLNSDLPPLTHWCAPSQVLYALIKVLVIIFTFSYVTSFQIF